MADLEHDVRNTPETIFESGSVAKQFTALAVVASVENSDLVLKRRPDSVIKLTATGPDNMSRLDWHGHLYPQRLRSS